MTTVQVKRTTLDAWKQTVNTLAATTSKDDRYRLGASLKQSMQDVMGGLDEAPSRWLIGAVDRAMVEMKDIHPPLTRTLCTRIILAALEYAPPSCDTESGGVASPSVLTGGRQVGMNTLREALKHLHTILNGRLNAAQMLAAEKEAREWLDSIGSEPS